MESQVKKKLIILKEDYDQLMQYVKNKKDLLKMEKVNAGPFLENLEEAQVLQRDHFPHDAIRLYSQVKIRDKQARYDYVYTIVLPDEADHRKGKVSVLSPIGTSMYGLRKGQDVAWRGAAGERWFTIMSVVQLYG